MPAPVADVIKRRPFIGLATGALAAAAVGCRHDRVQSGESRLIVFYPLEMGDGSSESFALDGSAQWLLFEPLMKRDLNGEWQPRLALRREHSADQHTWTIHLRPDVMWQDGEPFTAHDVKFTFDLLSHPDVLEAPAGFPPGSSVTVLNDSTFTINYTREIRDPLNDTPFYPRHLLEHLDPKSFRKWDFWTHPVGNGPYRFVRAVPMTLTEFAASPTYYRGRPTISRVVLKGLTAESALNELTSGSVDVIWLDPKSLPAVRQDQRFHVYYTAWPAMLNAIVWHHGHPLFREATMRRALTLAINRAELRQLLNLPKEIPVLDVVPSERQFRRGEVPGPLPFDPVGAKRLLDEAGWRVVGADGTRERAGRPFRFTALVGGDPASAVYIQAQLRAVGVQMDLETMDWSTVRARTRAGDFEAVMMRMNTGPGALSDWFGDGCPFGYANSRVSALIREAQLTADPNDLDRVYRALMPIFQADVPVTFLFPRVFATVAARKLSGLRSPYGADMVYHMEELWLDDGRH